MQSYEGDIAARANEQAWLLRTKRRDRLDIEHIAEEIEDVGKSEQREPATRMAVLLLHPLRCSLEFRLPRSLRFKICLHCLNL